MSDEHSTASHVVSPRVYVAVFAALIAMTLLTIGASSVDLGPFNVAVALGIAGVKATLVILYFMNVRYSPRLVWLVIGGATAWLGVLIVVTMSDYLSRGWLPFPGK